MGRIHFLYTKSWRLTQVANQLPCFVVTTGHGREIFFSFKENLLWDKPLRKKYWLLI